MKIKGICLVSWLFTATAGLGADVMLEITPHFGYRWGGTIETEEEEQVDLKGGVAYGLSLDYRPRGEEDIKLELFWSRQEGAIDFEGVGWSENMDITVDEFMIGGVLEANSGRLYGHITGLLGATVFSPADGDTDVRFSISLGAGVKYFLFRNLALRADVRGFCNFVDGEGSFIYSDGVTVARWSGDTLWQGEVAAGITVAF